MNEILEEFKIVFGFDDKPLQEGIKKTENSLNGLGKLFGAITASFISFQGLKALTVEYADFNVKLNESTSLLGLNAEEVSALGGALERFGGNTDSAISSLKSLNSSLEESKRGQGALVEVSRKYGLSFSPYASATDTLKSLSKQMGRFSDQQRVVIAQQLGLDDSLVRAFKDGGVELEKQIERQKKWGTATEEDVKISKAFNNAQLDLKDIFGALTREFARVILPSFTKLVELFSSFIEWVRQHKQLVIIFFTALLVAMTPVLIMLGKIALASVLAFKPFYASLAIIAGVSLIIEDIYGYFMGWDSVTGDLVNKFPTLGILLEGIRPIVLGIAETFEKIVEWLKDPTLEKFGDIFKTAGNTLLEFLIKPFEAFKNMFSGWWDSAKDIGSSIAGWFKSDNKKEGLSIPESPEEKEVKEKLANNNKDIKENIPKEGANEKEVKEKIINNNNEIKEFSKIESKNEKEVKEKLIENNKNIKENINITVKNEKSIPNPPQMPYQNSVVNKQQSNQYNVNNNFNQNISTATPKQFADNTNSQIVSSITDIRQQNGAL